MNKQQTIIQKLPFDRSQIVDFETSLSVIAADVNFPEPDGLKKLGDSLRTNRVQKSVISWRSSTSVQENCLNILMRLINLEISPAPSHQSERAPSRLELWWLFRCKNCPFLRNLERSPRKRSEKLGDQRRFARMIAKVPQKVLSKLLEGFAKRGFGLYLRSHPQKDCEETRW